MLFIWVLELCRVWSSLHTAETYLMVTNSGSIAMVPKPKLSPQIRKAQPLRNQWKPERVEGNPKSPNMEALPVLRISDYGFPTELSNCLVKFLFFGVFFYILIFLSHLLVSLNSNRTFFIVYTLFIINILYDIIILNITIYILLFIYHYFYILCDHAFYTLKWCVKLICFFYAISILSVLYECFFDLSKPYLLSFGNKGLFWLNTPFI